MAISLLRRVALGRPRSFEEDDGNLDDIEGAINISSQYVSQCAVPITRASNNSSDTTEMTLASVKVPGGLMGLNSRLEIVCRWKFTGSTNTKIMAIYFNNIVISSISLNTLANVSGKFLVEIENQGSLLSQEIFNGSSYAVSNSAAVATTVDTSLDQLIDIRCKWGSNVSGESIVLKRYSIIHYPGIA
jgi:hypothetical protein